VAHVERPIFRAYDAVSRAGRDRSRGGRRQARLRAPDVHRHRAPVRRAQPCAQPQRGSPLARTAEEADATALQLSDHTESPLDEVEARELGGAIERAIGRLRPAYRTCILLRHVEGFSYEEIAQTLELPLGTVKTYIHRARNELREQLEALRD
jgi:RNA polymerase sigma factor (sigma-70 family)